MWGPGIDYCLYPSSPVKRYLPSKGRGRPREEPPGASLERIQHSVRAGRPAPAKLLIGDLAGDHRLALDLVEDLLVLGGAAALVGFLDRRLAALALGQLDERAARLLADALLDVADVQALEVGLADLDVGDVFVVPAGDVDELLEVGDVVE